MGRNSILDGTPVQDNTRDKHGGSLKRCSLSEHRPRLACQRRCWIRRFYRAGRHNSPCIMYKFLTSSAPRLCTVFPPLISATESLAGILLLCLHLIISIYDQGASCGPSRLVAAMIWLEKKRSRQGNGHERISRGAFALN